MKGNARVTVNEGSKYTQYWENQDGENGRNNNAKVTYTKNGEQVTEYYNYVAKASFYNDTMDLENGTIFLAAVEKGEDGKWHAAADNSDFSFSNYSKLLEAINIATKASEDMTEYNRAKEAVDAATAEVDRLKDELDKINKVSVDGTVLANLKAALEQAQADLEEAKETRDALADKVAKAKAIVESVDLSSVEGGKEVSGIASAVVAVAETATVTAATASSEASSEAVSVATTSREAASTEAAGGAATAVLGANVKAELDGTKKLVKIEDNEIPLAEMPYETDGSISWFWLLVITLLGATGKAMYENYMNKEEANS